MMTIGDRFVWIVEELEKGNRAEMARKLGVTGQSIINICNGSIPGGDTLVALLQAYPLISPDWLLLGREPRVRPTVSRSEKERAFDQIAAIVDGARTTD